MIAGALELQMFASLARLSKDMEEAKRMVGSSMKSIESSVASAKSVLGALGIGVGIGYFVSLIKGSIDAADHLEHLKKSTSLTITELAGLKLLAAESGSDLDGLAKGIDKMSVAMGKDPEKFRALGITAKDNKEAFKQFADIFNLLPDIQQRNALAHAVFNKSWVEMAPALSLGGKAIGEVMAKGAQLSGVTEDMTRSAHEFKVQMAELETTLGATKNKLVSDMLPAMNRIAEAMREAAKEGGLLMTVIVGLGGAITEAFGDSPMKKAQQNVDDLTAKLMYWQKQQSTGPVMRFFIRHDYEGELAQAQLNLANAQRILAALKNPATSPGAPGADPAAAAAAAARAAAFLRDAKLAAAEVKLFTSSLQALEKEYFTLTHAGEVAKIMWEEQYGSLQKLTPAHKAELLLMAAKIDAYNRLLIIQAESGKRIESEAIAIEKGRDAKLDFAAALRDEISEMTFQNSLFGKTKDEQELLTAARKIDLDVRQRILALGPDEDGLMAAAIETMRKHADAQKEILGGMILVRQKLDREWTTGANAAFQDYIDHATNAAEQAKNLFVNAFKSMEDALVEFVMTGKFDFKSLADSIIRDLIRIQIQQTIMAPLAKSVKDNGGLVGLIGQLFAGGSANTAGMTTGTYGAAVVGGPAYAEGTDYVPRTGWAMLHQGERVVTAAENRGSGEVTIVQHINVDSRSDRASIIQAMRFAAEKAKSDIADSLRRGSDRFRSP